MLDSKPTGRKLFEMNKQAFEDLTLEEAPQDDDQYEETKEEDDEGEEFMYDSSLYKEGVEDEEIDFD